MVGKWICLKRKNQFLSKNRKLCSLLSRSLIIGEALQQCWTKSNQLLQEAPQTEGGYASLLLSNSHAAADCICHCRMYCACSEAKKHFKTHVHFMPLTFRKSKVLLWRVQCAIYEQWTAKFQYQFQADNSWWFHRLTCYSAF